MTDDYQLLAAAFSTALTVDEVDLGEIANEFTQATVAAEDKMEAIFDVYDLSNPQGHPTGNIEIKIELMDHFDGLEVPKYQTDLASGFDILAAIDEPISLNTIGSTALIPTGIKLEIPPGFEAQVRPRSGLAAKHGITVTNTPGTIDADYRGEIKVSLTKVNMSGGRFKVERGMRIAQVVICPVVQPPLRVVDQLSSTERGEKGFGSTGIS